MSKKYKCIILLFLSFAYTKQCCSQLNIDSLKKELVKMPNDTSSIRQLFSMVSKYRRNDLKACLAIYQEALVKSSVLNNDTLQCKSYLNCSGIYNELGDFSNAIMHLGQAEKLAYAAGNKDLQIKVTAQTGLLYVLNDQPDIGLDYYKIALRKCDEPRFKSTKMILLANIGGAYYEKAGKLSLNQDTIRYGIKYTKQAFELAREINYQQQILVQGNNMALMYMDIKRYDSARYYLEYTEPLITTDNARSRMNYLANMGRLSMAQKRPADAITYFLAALPYAKKLNVPLSEYKFYAELADAYQLLGDNKEALNFHRKYFHLKDSLVNLQNFTKVAELQATFERAKKDNEIKKLEAEKVIKQLELDKQNAIIAGNILEANIKENEIKRLQAEDKIRQLELEKQKAIIAGNKLEAQRKEDEIRLLSQEKALQDFQIKEQSDLIAKSKLQATADSQKIQLGLQESLLKVKQISIQKKTRNFLLVSTGVLGLLSFLFYRNFYEKKKAYKKLEQKSLQIKEQALQLGKQAKQIAQFQSQMNPHFVYNALHNIQGLVLTDEKQKANKQIQSLAQLMRKTFANAEKDDIPVEEEITYLYKYIEFEKAAIDSNLSFDIQVAKEAEGALIPPMMIQPFIENAIKHAELTNVPNPYIKVLIETENNLLAINVKDNGTGIKKDLAESDKLSHSMFVIKSRLDLIFKGKADINSQPVFSIKTVPELSEGTSIKFYLPLNYSY